MGNTNQNRINSLKSTGPRTEEGKRASSGNSLKHGLSGTHMVLLPTEDPEAYQSHLADYQQMLKPDNDQERNLVLTLAQTRWRLNRCAAIEAGLFTEAMEDADSNLSLAQAFKASTDTFLKLSTYEQRLSRIYQNTKKELDTLQAARDKASKVEMFVAKRIANSFEKNDSPFHPDQFGFVSSKETIDRQILRDQALSSNFDFPKAHEINAPEALAS